MDEITLKVGSDIYAGWTSIDVARSLDQGADTFDLGYSVDPQSPEKPIPIYEDMDCAILLNSKRIITGVVDDVLPSYDSKARTLSASGRSRIAELVDCALPIGMDDTGSAQFMQQTLPQVARALAKPFGIKVHVQTDVTFATSTVTSYNPGERVYEYLEKRARADGVMLRGDANGDLLITRASNRRIKKTAIRLGENARSCKGKRSRTERFSHYYYPSQSATTDTRHGESAAHVLGRSSDSRVRRYRPTVVVDLNLDDAQAAQRAKWEANVRYGRSRQATYTVDGWSHAEGVWEPDYEVLVNDEWNSFSNEWLMISSVRYLLDEEGPRTEITVMPRQAFDLIPMPEKD